MYTCLGTDRIQRKESDNMASALSNRNRHKKNERKMSCTFAISQGSSDIIDQLRDKLGLPSRSAVVEHMVQTYGTKTIKVTK